VEGIQPEILDAECIVRRVVEVGRGG